MLKSSDQGSKSWRYANELMCTILSLAFDSSDVTVTNCMQVYLRTPKSVQLWLDDSAQASKS